MPTRCDVEVEFLSWGEGLWGGMGARRGGDFFKLSKNIKLKKKNNQYKQR
jgi:hypothetical protein